MSIVFQQKLLPELLPPVATVGGWYQGRAISAQHRLLCREDFVLRLSHTICSVQLDPSPLLLFSHRSLLLWWRMDWGSLVSHHGTLGRVMGGTAPMSLGRRGGCEVQHISN